jgi:hypothetical protein
MAEGAVVVGAAMARVEANGLRVVLDRSLKAALQEEMERQVV